MKLADAIRLATGKKIYIRNYKLDMRMQTAKSLLFWILVDTTSDYKAYKEFDKMMLSDDWELECE